MMGVACSEVTQPEEKHDGQNSHIRKDLKRGCVSLDLPCRLLLCPTYCIHPPTTTTTTLPPLSSSSPLHSLLHVSRAGCVAGLVFAAPTLFLSPADHSINQ